MSPWRPGTARPPWRPSRPALPPSTRSSSAGACSVTRTTCCGSRSPTWRPTSGCTWASWSACPGWPAPPPSSPSRRSSPAAGSPCHHAEPPRPTPHTTIRQRDPRSSQGEQGAGLGDEVDQGDHGKEDANGQPQPPLGGAERERGPDPSPGDDADHQQDGQPPVDVPEKGVGDGGGDAEDPHTDQRGGDRRLQRQRQQLAEGRHHDHPTPDPQQPRQQPGNQADPGRDPTLPSLGPRGPWSRGVGARQPAPPLRGPPEGERSRTPIEVRRVVHSPGRRGGVVLDPTGERGAPGGEGEEEGDDRREEV